MAKKGRFSEIECYDDNGETVRIVVKPSIMRSLKIFAVAVGFFLFTLIHLLASIIASGGGIPIITLLFSIVAFLTSASLLLGLTGEKQVVEVKEGCLSLKNALFGLGLWKWYRAEDITEFSFGPGAGRQADKYSMQIWLKAGKKDAFILSGLPVEELKRIAGTIKERLFGQSRAAMAPQASVNTQNVISAPGTFPLPEPARTLEVGESFSLVGMHEGTLEVRQKPTKIVILSQNGPNRGIKAGMLFFAMLLLLPSAFLLVGAMKAFSATPFAIIGVVKGLLYLIFAIFLEAPLIFYLWIGWAKEIVEVSTQAVRIRRELFGMGRTHECNVNETSFFSLNPFVGSQWITSYGPFYLRCKNKVAMFGGVISDDQAREVFPLIVEKAGMDPALYLRQGI